MKGIETIVSRILGDAEISAGEIAAAAEAQAGQIAEEAEIKAKELYDRGMKVANTEAENVLLRGKSITDLEGRKVLLGARQAVVDEAFQKAEQKLENLRGDKDGYAKLLIDLAKPAVQEGNKVLLSKADYDAVGKAVEAGLAGVAVEGADMPNGGLVVVAGGIELNLTFAALLRQYREELEQAVASVLFH